MSTNNYQNVKNHRKLTKERVFYVMGEKCSLCGLKDKCLDIYDFHHLNPEEKDFTISQGLYNNAWSKLVKELKKGLYYVQIVIEKYTVILKNILNYYLLLLIKIEQMKLLN